MAKVELGVTHDAHESRHLPRHIARLRAGKYTQDEIKLTIDKLIKEKEALVEKHKVCCEELDIPVDLDYTEVPELTKEEAAKYKYTEHLEPIDFLFIKKLEMSYNYSFYEAPKKEHLHVGTMLLQHCINELNWAIAEFAAYLK